MHAEAMYEISESIRTWRNVVPGPRRVKVLEFGSRDINGSPRTCFANQDTYVGVDIEDGPGVDIVGNAAEVMVRTAVTHAHESLADFDIVICAEVFEHTPEWVEILQNMHRHLREAGLAIVTAACDPRLPHSAVDGENLGPDSTEYYKNIDPDDLRDCMVEIGFRSVAVKTHPRGDVYGWGLK